MNNNLQDSIKNTLLIDASLERVWELITDPDYIKQWYAYGGAEVELHIGGEISFKWDEHGKFYGLVKELEQYKHFSFQFVPMIPNVKPTKGNSTYVEFKLNVKGTKVELNFSESGYTKIDLHDKENEAQWQMSKRAWNKALTILKDLAEKDNS